MNRRSVRNFILFLIAVAAGAGASYGLRLSAEERAGRPADSEEKSNDETLKTLVWDSVLAPDAKGFRRMGPPSAGEWLFTNKEKPQSLDNYKVTTRIRPTPTRRTIVLQPLGQIDAEKMKLVESLREYAEIFFQLPVRIAEPIAIDVPGKNIYRTVPAGHRHGPWDKQYSSEKILSEILVKRLPEDAIVYLGITMEDLWAGDLNYVFGIGSLQERVGVYSLCRYFPDFWGEKPGANSARVGLTRSCKVLNHEAGHMFGLTHCVFYYCSMNGSNSLHETDLAPIHFCPVCHRKLLWNMGFDPEKRFTGLHDFYAKNGMKEDAEWLVERTKNWRAVMEREKFKKLTEE